ncbi:MAG: nucleotidyltransferase family protein [Desulfovibrionales bacterium]
MTISRYDSEPVGIIPAGGKAGRIAPLPCSKELFPLGFCTGKNGKSVRAKVAGQYLLERMRLAGARKAYIILREGKWDIPGFFSDGSDLDMDLAYLIAGLPYGAPFTLDQAHAFVRNQKVLFGFPDMIFRPKNAFIPLLHKMEKTGADVVLGLFPAQSPEKMDMVELDESGRIQGFDIKPDSTDLKWTWIIGSWTPAFTGFLHDMVGHGAYRRAFEQAYSPEKESYVGEVLQEALRTGMHIEAVFFPKGDYIDIGTPEDLVRAVQRETGHRGVCA